MERLFEFATVDFIAMTLVFFRMSSLVLTMPFFGGKQIPPQVKMAFVLGLTVLIYKTIDFEQAYIPTSIWEYGILIAKEMAIGIFLGSIASLGFFGVQLGGEIIGIQMGLAQGQALDPLTQTNIPTIGQFFTLFIMVIFLLFNGHHYLLRIFMDSYEYVPIFTPHYTERIFEFVIRSFNIVIEMGMRVAIPGLAFAFILRVVFGFMARLVPQMNIFVLSLPIQILGGLIITSFCLPLIVILFQGTMNKVFEDMYRLLILF